MHGDIILQQLVSQLCCFVRVWRVHDMLNKSRKHHMFHLTGNIVDFPENKVDFSDVN